MIVWVQMTGIVSSYFLLMGPLLIAYYRRVGGYWAALWATGCLMTFHAGAMVLEDLGVLRTAALFTQDPGSFYSARLYRYVSLLSLEGIYLMSFFAANVVATALREKDAAIDAAIREAERRRTGAMPTPASGPHPPAPG
jgi:hypothetical protein